MFTINAPHTRRNIAWDYLLMALFAVFGASAATAQAVHDKEVFTDPLDFILPAAAVPSCLQEDLHVTGTIKNMTHITTDGNGGVHIKGSQVVNAIGIGLESGDTYQVTGPLSYTLYTPDEVIARAEHLHNVILHIVGPGGDSKVLLLQTLRITTNANGEVIVDRAVEFEARCPTS